MVQIQSSGTTDLSLAQDVSNVSIIKTSPLTKSLSDLSSRIDQVLKLADPSDYWSGTVHTYLQANSVKYLHHFVTTVTFDDHSSEKALLDVMAGDMVRVAFTVCIETVFYSVSSAIISRRIDHICWIRAHI